MTDIEIRYFAVLDPDDPGRMTYWRRNNHGDLKPHPAAAAYGPTLWKRPGPGRLHVIPDGLYGAALKTWRRDWFRTVHGGWWRRLNAAVDADPIGAAIRFGLLTFRCCSCGRILTDPTSKTLGIGPDCRTGLPASVLTHLNEQVGRVHAEAVAAGRAA